MYKKVKMRCIRYSDLHLFDQAAILSDLDFTISADCCMLLLVIYLLKCLEDTIPSFPTVHLSTALQKSVFPSIETSEIVEMVQIQKCCFYQVEF